MPNEEKEGGNELMLARLAQVYLERATPVHLVYRNGKWKNGVIVEIRADFFILDEFVEGKVIVFFQELIAMPPFTPPPKKEEGIK